MKGILRFLSCTAKAIANAVFIALMWTIIIFTAAMLFVKDTFVELKKKTDYDGI